MHFTRRVRDCALSNLKINKIIKRILQTAQVIEFLEQYIRNWKIDVGRIISERITRTILNYEPNDERNMGRPLWRETDSVL
jgi:hypothetical protein